MSARSKLLISDLVLFIPGFALLLLSNFAFSSIRGTMGGAMGAVATVIAVMLASRGT